MKSFLADRAVVAPSATPIAAPSPLAPLVPVHAARPHAAQATPTVELVRDGEKVVRIVVTCPCGQRMELDCLYQP
jgi:hypothetical protein